MPSLCSTTATPSSEPSSSATSSFTKLPRETRDEIYSYIVPSYTQFNIFPTATADALWTIARHLPTSLLLNHQILEEAALLWLKRSKFIVQLGAFKALDDVLDQFPNEAGWKSVKQLEFMDWQQCYASRSRGNNKPTTTSGFIHDIVLRDSGLRRLSMTMVLQLLILPDHFDKNATVLRILERSKLTSLALYVEVPPSEFYRSEKDCEGLFRKCTAGLEQRAKEMGNELKIKKRVIISELGSPCSNSRWRKPHTMPSST
jgi:hypothetical protein